MGLLAHFLRNKWSWYVGLLVYPEFWGSFVWFTMYIQLGTRTATGGWPRGLPRARPRKTGSPYDNRYGSWVVVYKLLELVERFVRLFCFLQSLLNLGSNFICRSLCRYLLHLIAKQCNRSAEELGRSELGLRRFVSCCRINTVFSPASKLAHHKFSVRDRFAGYRPMLLRRNLINPCGNLGVLHQPTRFTVHRRILATAVESLAIRCRLIIAPSD